MSGNLNDQLFENYPDGAQQRDFFAALGRALSGWQFVESALYLVHEAAILPAFPSAFAASFHQVQTFRLKLQITDMALRACLIQRVNDAVLVTQDLILDDWIDLYKRMAEKSDRGNELAHFSVRIVHGKRAKSEGIRLRPNIADERFRLGIKKEADYGVSDINEWAEKFYELGNNVMEFAGKLRRVSQAPLPTFHG